MEATRFVHSDVFIQPGITWNYETGAPWEESDAGAWAVVPWEEIEAKINSGDEAAILCLLVPFLPELELLDIDVACIGPDDDEVFIRKAVKYLEDSRIHKNTRKMPTIRIRDSAGRNCRFELVTCIMQAMKLRKAEFINVDVDLGQWKILDFTRVPITLTSLRFRNCLVGFKTLNSFLNCATCLKHFSFITDDWVDHHRAGYVVMDPYHIRTGLEANCRDTLETLEISIYCPEEERYQQMGPLRRFSGLQEATVDFSSMHGPQNDVMEVLDWYLPKSIRNLTLHIDTKVYEWEDMHLYNPFYRFLDRHQRAFDSLQALRMITFKGIPRNSVQHILATLPKWREMDSRDINVRWE